MEQKNFGEILAPVGNEEMLIAAVRSGADAVYLGAKDFSARRNAENFSLSELKKAIDYCHTRGVRVYLTLNILIKENEMESAFNLARDAYNLGVDGLIVEDIGLARVLHENIPSLPLHASTQMSIHSPSALPVLKELGFCQVVAAREMSKSELDLLCQKAKELDITVEVFVHGALCMSVSGQCLLSAFLGSRSGNRGLCAGPCRLPFKAKGGTGYDLSLKDLSLLDYVKELYNMGVRSFKIEGRMKRPEYVAAATFAAKQALTEGKADENISQTLKDVFSRQGFTDGYYTNKLGKNMFGIRTKDDVLSANDAYPLLHEIYKRERQSVNIDVSLKIKENEKISLTLCDSKNTVTALGEIPKKAENRPIDKDSALKNILKFGSTPYLPQNVNVEIDDGLFVSGSELNALRRTACEMLDEKRATLSYKPSNAEYSYPVSFAEYIATKPKVYARFENAEQIPENLNGIDAVIYPLENDPCDIKDIKIPVVVDIPRGILNESLITKRLRLFKDFGVNTCLCGNLSAITIAKNEGFNIIGDQGLNIANTESLNTLKSLGVSSAIISAEELLEDIKALNSDIKKGIVAYGNIPLMLFKNCPLKNGISCDKCDKAGVLCDRLGISFPVRCRLGYSELLNSLPIWLFDRQDELLGLDFIVLYFTREDKNRIKEVLSALKNNSKPDTPHTRGLYYRGTI